MKLMFSSGSTENIQEKMKSGKFSIMKIKGCDVTELFQIKESDNFFSEEEVFNPRLIGNEERAISKSRKSIPSK